MSLKYSGRSAIVTGASSGIGRAIAQRLGRNGMSLWLVARSKQGLEETAAAIESAGGPPAHCAPLDLREPGVLSALVERVGEAHPHLFAMINNAGIMHPETIMSGRRERWEAMLDVNLLAPVESCQAAVRVMRRHGRPGHLINISSVAARFENGGVYGASKLALELVGRTLRHELEKDDIRVTTIVPGGFATNLGRDVEQESWAAIAKKLEAKGLEFGGADAHRVVGDPDYIAKAVEFVIDQPVDINFENLTIRPPVDSSW
jgi:NAD(P)-dependent dehydrogenase (short-subunit alcohol dehydrogenase family)